MNSIALLYVDLASLKLGGIVPLPIIQEGLQAPMTTPSSRAIPVMVRCCYQFSSVVLTFEKAV